MKKFQKQYSQYLVKKQCLFKIKYINKNKNLFYNEIYDFIIFYKSIKKDEL